MESSQLRSDMHSDGLLVLDYSKSDSFVISSSNRKAASSTSSFNACKDNEDVDDAAMLGFYSISTYNTLHHF